MNIQNWPFVLPMLAGAIVIAGTSLPARASTLCVNPHVGSCYPTIAKAVAAANAGDTIQVATGT